MAMKYSKRVSGTAQLGAKPAFCLKHVQGATRTKRGTGRRWILVQGIRSRFGGAKVGDARTTGAQIFASDIFLAKTEISAMGFLLAEFEGCFVASR